MTPEQSRHHGHETDFGVKADELATLLEEVLEQPGSKVVIFSQWLRMHGLLVRGIEKKPFDHVLFHGGVAGSQRKTLVDRFRDDDRCRAFLATDAGGVGLNLQHASVVVNMDLPWNPAVLEQRIGRVHRLGPATARSRRQFRCPGDDRGGHAVGAAMGAPSSALRTTPLTRAVPGVLRVGLAGGCAEPNSAITRAITNMACLLTRILRPKRDARMVVSVSDASCCERHG